MTPMHTTPKAPENGVIKTIDRIWHREGPLTAADLRDLNAVSQSIKDMYDALDILARLAAEEVEELANTGSEDPAKLARVHQARHALARFDDLTVERIDPEEVGDNWPEWADAPKSKP